MMKKKTLVHSLALLALFMPAFAYAVDAPDNLRELAENLILPLLQNVSALLFASLALGLVFGVVLFFANSDNEQKRASIKGYLLWGVIGIIVVMGIWGILALLRMSVFGTDVIGIPQISPPETGG